MQRQNHSKRYTVTILAMAAFLALALTGVAVQRAQVAEAATLTNDNAAVAQVEAVEHAGAGEQANANATAEFASTEGDYGDRTPNAKGEMPIYTEQQFIDSLEDTRGGTFYLAKDITIHDQRDAAGNIRSYLALVKQEVIIDMAHRTVTIDAEYPTISIGEGGSLTICEQQGRITSGGFYVAKANHNSVFDTQKGGTLSFEHIISSANNINASLFSAHAGSSITLTGGGWISECSAAVPLIVANAPSNEKATITFGNFTISKCSTASANPGAPIIRSFGKSAEIILAANASIEYCDFWSESIITAENKGSVTFSGLISHCGEPSSATEANRGPIVLVRNGGLFTMDCTDDDAHGIRKNVSRDIAGAIRVGEHNSELNIGSRAVLLNGVIAGNHPAEPHGQIYVCSNATFEMRGGTLQGWDASIQGSCVNIADRGKFNMYGGLLTSEAGTSVNKGGLVYNEGDMTMYGGTLNGENVNACDGGLICNRTPVSAFYSSSCTLLGGSLINGNANGNSLQVGRGGAICSQGNSQLTLGSEEQTDSELVIENCNAKDKGGALYTDGSVKVFIGYGVTITDCNAAYRGFANDEGAEAQETDPNIKARESYGGALCLDSSSDSLHMMGSATIAGCSTQSADSEKVDKGYGGGIYSRTLQMTIEKTVTIENCRAQTQGGGICINRESGIYDTNRPEIGGRLENNSAESGGGLYVYGYKVYVNGTFRDNTAAHGGAICVSNTTLYFDGKVSRNKAQDVKDSSGEYIAKGIGGGLFCENSIVDLGGTITDNTADTYAGGMYVANGEKSQVNFKPSGTHVVIQDNVCTYNTSYPNLFLDYLGQAGVSSKTPQTIVCTIVENSLNSDDSIHLSITEDSCRADGAHYREIVPNRGYPSQFVDQANYFHLDNDNGTMVLFCDQGHNAINVYLTSYVVQDRKSLERALSVGGEWPVVADIDLTNDYRSGGYEVSRAVTLAMNGHTITADTRKIGAPLFTVVADGKLSLGMEKEWSRGGLRGTATAQDHKNFHTAVMVKGGGEFNLNRASIEGFASGQYGEGAAVSVVTDPGTARPSGVFNVTYGAIGNCFSDNLHGAIYGRNNAIINLKGAHIEGAVGSRYGSCVCLSSGNLSATDTVFIGADSYYGGCLYLPVGTVTTLTDCTLDGGRAAMGGSICAEESSLTLISTQIHNAYAFEDTSREANRGGEGGGIYAKFVKLSIDATSRIENCTADVAGGGIWFCGSDTRGPLECAASVTANRSNGCGGAFYLSGTTGSKATISSTIRQNEASQYGGGIFLEPSLTLTFDGYASRNCAQKSGGGMLVASKETDGFVVGDLNTRVYDNTNGAGEPSNVVYLPNPEGWPLDSYDAQDSDEGSDKAGDTGDASAADARTLSRTGDTAPLAGVLALAVLSACGVVYAYTRKRQR